MDGQGPSPAELGISEKDLGIQMQSLDGKDLPQNWPVLLTPSEVTKGYEALYNPGDDKSKEPSNAHIDKLSYELINGQKRLRVFAAMHKESLDAHPVNKKQFDVLEQKFNSSPPDVAVHEGFITDNGQEIDIMDPKYRLTREDAISKGENVFMMYLVQQHNLKNPDNPITYENVDIPDEKLAEELRELKNDSGERKYSDVDIDTFFKDRFLRRVDNLYQDADVIRDTHIVRGMTEKFGKYDKVDMVFGSGHAIRDRKAFEQFFGQQAA